MSIKSSGDLRRCAAEQIVMKSFSECCKRSLTNETDLYVLRATEREFPVSDIPFHYSRVKPTGLHHVHRGSTVRERGGRRPTAVTNVSALRRRMRL
ncbi:hypothetical protein EVAR_18803_1 [Eumeta japonica]|uniref:Uncharacterized protein n=1 Tax=Eumeta variegata TaxID=151549 RepID=A0A4C1UMC1_EUMVA|nr:hypothetical protein EVAR_18803_1 [Eumeta japonica]